MSVDSSPDSDFSLENVLKWKAKPISYKIEYQDFKLKEFDALVPILDLNQEKSNLVTYYHDDMQKVFKLLELIRIRLNDDIDILNRENELNDKALRGTITDDEHKEMVSISETFVTYFYLDVKSFILWLNIFMDKSAKFLGWLFFNEKPEDNSFSSFKKSIMKIENEDLKELKLCINAYSGWHDEIKEIRDNNIIHHSQETTAIFRSSTGDIGVMVGKMVDNKYQSDYVDIETIESYILLINAYVGDLNRILCGKVDKLPFKVSLTRDDKKGVTLKIDRELVKWMKSQIGSSDEYPDMDSFFERLISNARSDTG